MKYMLGVLLLIVALKNDSVAQKVLQIEKFGRAKTKKIYLGETIFIQTVDNPDWFTAPIEDLNTDAQAIVFYDRIIPIKDITAVKFRKKSSLNGVGKAVQWSWVVPVTYQALFDLANPPSAEERRQSWIATGVISAGSFLLGSVMRIIPPKKLKFGKGQRRRLRVLDLTFYPKEVRGY
ncbi:MAG: hypothetical protein AAGJ18_19050 [Bacteroidota bacterium]